MEGELGPSARAPHRPLAQRPGRQPTCASSRGRRARTSKHRHRLMQAWSPFARGTRTPRCRATRTSTRAQRSPSGTTRSPTSRCWTATAGLRLGARSGMDECPLGSGALSGTAFPIDRVASPGTRLRAAEAHHIDASPTATSWPRRCSACSLRASTSPAGEDWIFFASSEAGFWSLGRGDDRQQHDAAEEEPRALELIRGKSSRLIGGSRASSRCLKGLPLATTRTSRRTRRPCSSRSTTLAACLAMATLAVRGARVRREAAATGSGPRPPERH